MANPLDAVAAVAGAVPGAAFVAPDRSTEQALHVRLVPGADGADVALAVSRLLAASDDTTGDVASRRTITVPDPRRPERPRVVRLDVHTEGPAFAVGVALTCAARTAHGKARSALTTVGKHRAIAGATLQAVEGLLPSAVSLELDHVERSDAAPAPVMLVHVTLANAGHVQRLVGSAAVREDEESAVLRAALDAVNRRIDALVEN